MLRPIKTLLLRAMLLALMTAPAFASGANYGSSENAQRCYDNTLTPDQEIAACQNSLLSGVLDQRSAAATYQNMGVAYMKKGDYPHALEAFNYIIKWSPTLWQAYANRSEIYLYMKQYDAALQDINKVIALQPDRWETYQERATIYESMGQADAARQDMEKVGTMVPDDAKNYSKLCSLLAGKMSGFDAALADCSHAISMDPKNADMLANRALVYYRMEQFDQAVADASQAISLKPDMARTYNIRANSYAGLQQNQKALDDFAQSLTLRPNSAGTFHDRASVYESMQRYDLAKRDLDAAISITPKESYLLTRAHFSGFHGDLSGALADYAQLLSMNPQSTEALNGRCWTRAEVGKELDLALADCDKAVSLADKDADIRDSRGFVHFRMNDYAAAIADLDAALVINPKEKSSLYVRGLAKLKTGDVAGGNADIAAAKAIDPKIADTYARYGVTP